MALSPSSSSERDVRTLSSQLLQQDREEQRRLRSVCNSRQPISTLPTEIFVEILDIVRAISEDREHEEMVEVCSWMSWIPLTCVCQQWRNVICSTPHLWRDVHVWCNIEWLKLCIGRSRSIPLHVYIHYPAMIPNFMNELAKDAHRITRLVLDNMTDNTMDCLNQLSLVSLAELSIDTTDMMGWQIEGDQLSEVRFPALHSLQLSHHRIDYFSPSMHRLRVLHLSEWGQWNEDASDMLKFGEFLWALAEFRHLEKFMLDFAFPFTTWVDIGERDVSGPMVSLPNLRFLYILCAAHENPDSPDVYHLLDHLKLPADATVNLYVQVSHPTRGGYRDILPNKPELYPILGTATSIEVWDRGFDCRAGPGEHVAKLGVTVEHADEAADTQVYFPSMAVDEFTELLKDAPLRELTSLGVHYDRAIWIRIFQAFPAVHTFTIQEEVFDYPYMGMLHLEEQKALAIERRVRVEVEKNLEVFAGLAGLSGADPAEGVVLPRLQEIRCQGVKWHAETFRALGKCLRERDKMGARLRSLKLECTGRDLSENGRGQHAAFIADFQSLVDGPVEYVDITQAQY